MSQRFWFRMRASFAKFLGVSLRHPQDLYAETIGTMLKPGDRWLDIGCGRQIVPDWAMREANQRELVSRCRCLVGIDVDSAIREHPLLTHRVCALGNHIPFRSGTFDFVTANVVMEHVDDPQQFLTEVRRILRPGGRFVFHTPNYHHPAIFIASLVPGTIKNAIVYFLERRGEEDIFPTHYRMNTVTDIRRHAECAGFKVGGIDIVGPYGMFILLGPIAVMEVLMLKIYSFGFMKMLRSNFIVQLISNRRSSDTL